MGFCPPLVEIFHWLALSGKARTYTSSLPDELDGYASHLPWGENTAALSVGRQSSVHVAIRLGDQRHPLSCGVYPLNRRHQDSRACAGFAVHQGSGARHIVLSFVRRRMEPHVI